MSTIILANQDHIFLLVCILGFIKFITKFIKFLNWVWLIFIRPPKTLTNYGKWALITGCTDGIGKALTFELALKGLNLILVGRNPPKLQFISSEVLRRFEKIEIRTIVIDFDKENRREVEDKIIRVINGLDVGVLVNNVGVADKPKFFHEVDDDGFNSVIDVNVRSFTWVTKAVIPVMLRKKKGCVVNIGSGSSVCVPSYPFFTTYASAKAYIAMFSRSLSVEYKQYGIDIQCQVPLLVATKMTAMKPSFFIPSPEQFSKASIRWFGYDLLCVPYWTHALQWCLTNSLPDSLVTWYLFQYCLGMRNEVIQKEVRQTK